MLWSYTVVGIGSRSYQTNYWTETVYEKTIHIDNRGEIPIIYNCSAPAVTLVRVLVINAVLIILNKNILI